MIVHTPDPQWRRPKNHLVVPLPPVRSAVVVLAAEYGAAPPDLGGVRGKMGAVLAAI